MSFNLGPKLVASVTAFVVVAGKRKQRTLFCISTRCPRAKWPWQKEICKLNLIWSYLCRFGILTLSLKFNFGLIGIWIGLLVWCDFFNFIPMKTRIKWLPWFPAKNLVCLYLCKYNVNANFLVFDLIFVLSPTTYCANYILNYATFRCILKDEILSTGAFLF